MSDLQQSTTSKPPDFAEPEQKTDLTPKPEHEHEHEQKPEPSRKPGEAPIKAEYLIPKNKRSREELQEEEKEQVDVKEAASEPSEPPRKRAKPAKPKEIMLCNSVKTVINLFDCAMIQCQGNQCTFSNCKFSHDVVAYLAAKLPDIGPACHMFRTYGKCPYAITCRFGGDHIKVLFH